ncbi:bZIP transcription factor [Nitzschia inconspicua]|uniref:BZIP transcription factor n=1 Tax=Nitzschia inconspicua TaxID=303405 RepID=A0A9K3LD58_9STRA|nr:bZIP transcription factor [Nitzschia inconspicua]
MATVEQVPAAAVPDSQLPMRKRKKTDGDEENSYAGATPEPASKAPKMDDSTKVAKRPGMTKAREIRLEQNRKAARESRRRKKVMIEELQRSVIFFSRANSTLKQQNDDLARLLMQAQAQVSVIESGEKANAPEAVESKPAAIVTAVVAPPLPQPQPTSAEAAAMAGTLPPMQPGATMQAMANFQQAAAAAMHAAVQGMKGIPGVSLQSLATPAPGAVGVNPQQAYNDTMTALAMQQAAVAAAAAAATSQQQYAVKGTSTVAPPIAAPADSDHGVTV